MRVKIFSAIIWYSLAAGLLQGGIPARAEIAFPADLFGIKQLADQIRSPLRQKMRDMRSAFGTLALSDQRVDFVGDNGAKKMGIKYIRNLSPDKSTRHEETQVSVDGKLVITESIQTQGQDLEFSNPVRAYIDGSPEYDLLPKETAKIVILRFGTDEAIRFVSHRGPDAVQTKVFYGSTLVLTVVDALVNQGTQRVLDYRMTGNRFRTGGLGSFSSGESSPHSCRMIGRTLLGADLRFSCDGTTVNTYLKFTNLINDYVVSPLYANSIQPLIGKLVQSEFPSVARPKNLATQGKVYTELQNLVALMNTLPTNPILLIISTTLKSYIGFIEDGTLEIKDSRP